MLDVSWQDIALHRAKRVGDALDDEGLHPTQHDSELLVGVAVRRNRGSGAELDQVHHGILTEERAALDAGDEAERRDVSEPDELRPQRQHCLILSVLLEKWQVLQSLSSFRMPTLETGGLLREQAYVDGAWVDADSGATFPVVDPATGSIIANVPRLGATETRRAIEAAQRALPA